MVNLVEYRDLAIQANILPIAMELSKFIIYLC